MPVPVLVLLLRTRPPHATRRVRARVPQTDVRCWSRPAYIALTPGAVLLHVLRSVSRVPQTDVRCWSRAAYVALTLGTVLRYLWLRN